MTLENFRCFPVGRPASIEIGSGFRSVIGVNNAGKSALVRSFYEVRAINAHLSNVDAFRTAASTGWGGEVFMGVRDQAEVFSNLNDLPLSIGYELIPENEADEKRLREANCPTRLRIVVSRPPSRVSLSFDNPRVDPSSGGDWSGWVLRQGDHSFDFSLWGASMLDLSRTLYIGPHRHAVSAGGGGYYDLQVGASFVEMWRRMRGGVNRDERGRAIAVNSAVARVFGYSRVSIDAAAEGDHLIVELDGQTYRLEELGGGIGNFIIVIAYALIHKPTFIFIDEPELNLHPSLQRDFLTEVGSRASHGVLFATHSIGLARVMSERIYSVRFREPGISEIRPLGETRDYGEFLGELSFSGYVELGFERVLLVEGQTEVPAFQRLLQKYGLEHKIVLIPLGGSGSIKAASVVHLRELQRITKNISAIVDSERAAPGAALDANRVGFVAACEETGVDLCVLERRALENYWTDRAIRAALGRDDCSALGPYQSLKEAGSPWPKSKNYLIADAMREDELSATDLGVALLKLQSLCACPKCL